MLSPTDRLSSDIYIGDCHKEVLELHNINIFIGKVLIPDMVLFFLLPPPPAPPPTETLMTSQIYNHITRLILYHNESVCP